MEVSCTLLLAKRDLQYVPLVGFMETPPGTSDFYKEVLLHLIRYLERFNGLSRITQHDRQKQDSNSIPAFTPKATDIFGTWGVFFCWRS